VRSADPWPAGLLVAYPPGWRARYGDELDQLIADLRAGGRRPVPMALDLLRGAAAAWLTDRRFRMSERSRGALFTVLWSWVAFAAVAAWFGHDLAIFPTASIARHIALDHPAVPDAYHVLLAAGSVGVVATVIAAVAFAIGAVRDARAHGRRGVYFLMAVPPVSAALWLGGQRLLPKGSAANGSGPGGLDVLWLLLGVALIAASTQAVIMIITACEFDAVTWRIGGAVAAAVTAAMLVASGATIAWGLIIRPDLPQRGDAGGWLITTVIMAVTTARAVIALIGARRAANGEHITAFSAM
jgi:hypothetical protein